MSQISFFFASTNPNLTCIYTDDVAFSEAYWRNIDTTSTFVANEAACQTLGVEDVEILGFTFYPNPTTDILHISAQENIDQICIYNMLGQEVKNSNPVATNFTIDVSNLPAGTYFLKAQIGNHIGTFKIIKL